MRTGRPLADPPGPVLVAGLAVSLLGVGVFGSVVGAVGEWVEGRELATVAPWALPALGLALAASATSARALLTARSRRLALALSLLVGVTLGLLVLANPSLSPPVAVAATAAAPRRGAAGRLGTRPRGGGPLAPRRAVSLRGARARPASRPCGGS
jgi:hypothetical protein